MQLSCRSGVIVVIGLGNPGKDYAEHRHNVGFMAAEAWADADHASPADKFGGGALRIARSGTGERLFYFRPMTYMNRSGIPSAALLNFYKIPPERVLVIHDDLDLPAGTVRTKIGGGHGGHNGLKSLDAHIGNGYRRLRIGIGHPGQREAVEGWVLGAFTPPQRTVIDGVIGNIVTLRNDWLCGTPDVAARTCIKEQ